jgi:hypothetical protein
MFGSKQEEAGAVRMVPEWEGKKFPEPDLSHFHTPIPAGHSQSATWGSDFENLPRTSLSWLGAPPSRLCDPSSWAHLEPADPWVFHTPILCVSSESQHWAGEGSNSCSEPPSALCPGGTGIGALAMPGNWVPPLRVNRRAAMLELNPHPLKVCYWKFFT